jgi:hypothetical protein
MTDLAKELRRLAHDIEALARESSAHSLICKHIDTLADHLCARARIIEYNNQPVEKQK